MGFMENLTGRMGVSDRMIATDLSISAKNAVRSYAIALTETSNPEVRRILRHQMESALNAHERIIDYMVSKGFYHVDNIDEQVKLDLANATEALQLPAENTPVL